jgi:phosphoglycolate phosphatase
VNATRVHAGSSTLPDDVVASYVGNGAPVLIRRAFPDVSDQEHARLLRYFLDYYRDHMLDATTLYPGVREALDRLHAAEVAMAVLTNKPVRFSVGLLEGLGIDTHFFRIYGGNSFEEKKPNPIGIRMLMEESGAVRERTLMVGDSAVDVLTARNARVPACGVRWGFQPESFATTPPDYLIDDMGEILDLIK